METLLLTQALETCHPDSGLLISTFCLMDLVLSELSISNPVKKPGMENLTHPCHKLPGTEMQAS